MPGTEIEEVHPDPIVIARQVAEQQVPEDKRAPDWDERWNAVATYCADLLAGQPAPLVVSEEDRIAVAKLDYAHNIAEVNQRLGFQQELAIEALKGLTLVNGGAIIALLTFIGNSSAALDRTPLWWSFLCFGLGIGLSLAAYIGGYFSQAQFMEVSIRQAWDDQREMVGLPKQANFWPNFKRGNRALYAAIGCAVTSLASFAAGAAFALAGIL